MAPLSVHSPGRGTRTRMPSLGRPLLGQDAQPRVRCDTTADEDVLDPLGDGGADRLAGQHVAHRLLERRGDVGDRHRVSGVLARLHPAGDRGLEAGEGEVEAVPLEVAPRGQPAREVDGDRRAGEGGAVDVRAAGERQAEQPGDLVEGLPRGVVDGGPQRLDGSRSRHPPAAGRSGRRTRASRGTGPAAVRARAGRRPRARRGGSRRTAACRGRGPATSRQRLPPAARRPVPGRRSRRSRRRRFSDTPAVAQARWIVGTIASRWARDATSGTTPPNRACSSTEEATASASRVCPRTMPDPGLVARGLDAEHQRRGGRGGGHRAIVPMPRMPASRSTTAVAPSA